MAATKSEAGSSKSETNSNDKKPKVLNESKDFANTEVATEVAEKRAEKTRRCRIVVRIYNDFHCLLFDRITG